MNKMTRWFTSTDKELLLKVTKYFSEDDYMFNDVKQRRIDGRYYTWARINKVQFKEIKEHFNIIREYRNNYIVIS